MGKKRKKSEVKGPPAWMVTMGDMNNLLMCFFIVMMGDISVTTGEEFQMTITSFRGGLGIMEGGRSMSKGKLAELGHNITTLPSSTQGRAMGKALHKATEAFKPEIQSKYVRVQEDERGLIITLASDFFFDPGSARLKEEMRPVLGKIATILKDIDNFVRVEGHTDNSPITKTQIREGFRSNWDLSSARSLSILQYLTEEEEINPKTMSSVAFGEFRPIDDNNTPEGRAYNRRVDIVILKQHYLEESKDKKIPRPLPDEEWR